MIFGIFCLSCCIEREKSKGKLGSGIRRFEDSETPPLSNFFNMNSKEEVGESAEADIASAANSATVEFGGVGHRCVFMSGGSLSLYIEDCAAESQRFCEYNQAPPGDRRRRRRRQHTTTSPVQSPPPASDTNCSWQRQ